MELCGQLHPAQPSDTVIELLGYEYGIKTSQWTNGTFKLHLDSVVPRSYVLSIDSSAHTFPQIRVDVNENATVSAWEQVGLSYGWNDYGDKLESNPCIQIKATGHANYYQRRQGFSIMQILKQPTLLISLVSVGLLFLAPKLSGMIEAEAAQQAAAAAESK